MIMRKITENEKREAHKPVQEVCYKGAGNIQLRIERRKHNTRFDELQGKD